MFLRTFLVLVSTVAAFSQSPPIEPGVSQELARWRAAHYSDVRYKLNLTLEKMSPVLKGSMEIRVNVGARTLLSAPSQGGGVPPIILDWRKIRGVEDRSTVRNVTINGKDAVSVSPQAAIADGGVRVPFEESNEHLVFREGVVLGENVIKLDFTSPILTSGSAITRYVDKEDGSEYIYSLFVPSDASTAFPVFDQPDLKAKFTLRTFVPISQGGASWITISNSAVISRSIGGRYGLDENYRDAAAGVKTEFAETKPISTYVFAFAAGPWQEFNESNAAVPAAGLRASRPRLAAGHRQDSQRDAGVTSRIYVRKSQAEKFKPHAAEVFRLNREGIKFLETYFDYKFPFPKYDIVLIPEFPFNGMEHAGATFLRETSVIFPSEPTANDYISRANVIFHEAAHQWFGDTVTMRWFDDLWLKEGFAEFMAYKTLEKVMPQYNAWKAFYERNKPLAYQTDSTRGTVPIYQEIKNLSAAKSAYGNIVYRKAPSFLKQAEFYLGADKFQTAVRAFLKKHEYANAEWVDLVNEFETASNKGLQKWANEWITQRALPVFRTKQEKTANKVEIVIQPEDIFNEGRVWTLKTNALIRDPQMPELEMSTVIDFRTSDRVMFGWFKELEQSHAETNFQFVFPNYQDYGYGIFLLDDKSRDYVLKNIQNERDDFLRAMMWGSLWDSVREAELDPREYVELAIKNIGLEKDELTILTILNRVSTAMTYYIPDRQRDAIAPRLEALLLDRLTSASTLGQRTTYYRAFINIVSTANGRNALKRILRGDYANWSEPRAVATGAKVAKKSPPGSKIQLVLRTKDRFDIVTKLAILNDPEAATLLANLEKTETGDDAKRYAYAAKAAFPTKETKEKFWNDFVSNKEISESWIEAAFGPFNSPRHAELTLPYLERALRELPNHKRNRKIFFVNGWLAAFIGGQKSEQALAVVNKLLADNLDLDRDLRLKILENVDIIERAMKIRKKYGS